MDQKISIFTREDEVEYITTKGEFNEREWGIDAVITDAENKKIRLLIPWENIYCVKFSEPKTV